MRRDYPVALDGATIIPMTSALDDIRHRMRIANLEARLALGEIECADLKRKIKSPLTPSLIREEAILRHEDRLDECTAIAGELKTLRKDFDF